MKSTGASIQDNKFGIMHYLHKLFDPPVLFAEKELSEQMAGLRLFVIVWEHRFKVSDFCVLHVEAWAVWPNPENLTFMSGSSSRGLS